MRISMRTALGIRIRPTVPCGFQRASPLIGRLITPATGLLSVPGDGRGVTMPLGVLRHSIMGGGLMWAADGDGFLVRSRSSDLALEWWSSRADGACARFTLRR